MTATMRKYDCNNQATIIDYLPINTPILDIIKSYRDQYGIGKYSKSYVKNKKPIKEVFYVSTDLKDAITENKNFASLNEKQGHVNMDIIKVQLEAFEAMVEAKLKIYESQFEIMANASEQMYKASMNQMKRVNELFEMHLETQNDFGASSKDENKSESLSDIMSVVQSMGEKKGNTETSEGQEALQELLTKFS